MKDKVVKFLLYSTLTLVIVSFLPWVYLTTYYAILRHAIFACMLTNVMLNFSVEKIFNERFMRLFLVTILIVFAEFLCFHLFNHHYRLEDFSQLIVAFLCITLGITLPISLKQWGNIIYYFTIGVIIMGTINCLYHAGGLYIPEHYMLNEGKNQVGAIIAISGIACYFLGIKNKNERTAFFVLFFLCLLLLLLIRARSDFFALVLCAIFLSIKDFNWKFSWSIKTIISCICIIFIGYIIYTGFISNELHTFMAGGKASGDIDVITSNRIERNQQAINYFFNESIIGEQTDEADILLIHNYFLLRLVRYGIFSIPLLAFYLYFGIKTLCRLFRARKTDLREIGFVACTIPLIVSFVEPNFPYGPGSVQMLSFLLLGVSFAQNRNPKRYTNNTTSQNENGKVLHICNDFTYSKVHTELYQHLDQQGIDQIVYSPIRNAKLTGNNLFEGKHTSIIYSLILKPWHRLFFNRKIEKIGKDIEQKIDLREISYIHATNLFSDGAVALHLKQQTGIPYIVAVRNTDINVFLKLPHLWWVHRAVIREADKVVFISPAIAKRLQSHFTLLGMRKILREKSIVQPNGIHPYWLKHLHLNASQHAQSHRICYVGNFDHNKNVLRLIQSVLQLRNEFSDIHLDLIGGNGNCEKEVLNLVSQHPEVLSYRGKIYDKEILKATYLENSIFAMPSIHETFGLVYIEALSQGLSVLYTKNEGIDGLFSVPVGERVSPTSIEDIMQALRKLLLKPEQYATLSEEDFRAFDWCSIAQGYIQWGYHKNK